MKAINKLAICRSGVMCHSYCCHTSLFCTFRYCVVVLIAFVLQSIPESRCLDSSFLVPGIALNESYIIEQGDDALTTGSGGTWRFVWRSVSPGSVVEECLPG